jgi:hypothetical protein
MKDCVRESDIRQHVGFGGYRRSVEDFVGFPGWSDHVRYLCRQWRALFVDLLSFDTVGS